MRLTTLLIEGDFHNYRGIPTDIHPIHKISGVEIALTKLHGDGYRGLRRPPQGGTKRP